MKNSYDEHLLHYENGDKLYKKEKYKEALVEFEKALVPLPKDSDTNWAVADCYSELGKPDLAEKYYRIALENCPVKEKEALLFNLGNALFDQMKYKDSINHYIQIKNNSELGKKAKRNINLAKRKIEKY